MFALHIIMQQPFSILSLTVIPLDPMSAVNWRLPIMYVKARVPEEPISVGSAVTGPKLQPWERRQSAKVPHTFYLFVQATYLRQRAW